MTLESQSLELINAAKKLVKAGKIGHSDPGIAIAYNEAGLRAHHPARDADQARADIQDAIVAAGMVPAAGFNDAASNALFTGRPVASMAAQDAVNALVWTRHRAGVPDVGEFFFVFPRGANNVEFVLSAHMFNR